MGDQVELYLCCVADEAPNVYICAPPTEELEESAPFAEAWAETAPEPARSAPPPAYLGDAAAAASKAETPVVYCVSFECGGMLGFALTDGPRVAVGQLRAASDGSAGRSQRLGVQTGDILLQVAGVDIIEAAAASGSTAFEAGCALLRDASFPIEVGGCGGLSVAVTSAGHDRRL